jgi:hypothetical protein
VTVENVIDVFSDLRSVFSKYSDHFESWRQVQLPFMYFTPARRSSAAASIAVCGIFLAVWAGMGR